MTSVKALGRGAVLCFGALLFTVITATLAIPQLRWRAHVALLSVTGQIPDIRVSEVLAYMLPGTISR